MTQEETKNLPKNCLSLKSCVSFYTCPHAPFIGRWRDFYIPKTPSNSKNIPSVNMYTNVFYILYIYKPATSSHAKPGLFGTTSLTLLLTGSWIPPLRKSPRVVTSELDLQQALEFHDFAGPWLRVFTNSRLRSFARSRFQIIARSRLWGFASSRFQVFAHSRLWGFAGSRFQIFTHSRLWGFAGSRFVSSVFLKTHYTNFMNLDVSRVTCFPELPDSRNY
jgi:hypothetical protein